MTYQVINDIETKLVAALTTTDVVSNPINARPLEKGQTVAITAPNVAYTKAGNSRSVQLQMALHVVTLGADTQSTCHDLTDQVVQLINEFVVNKTAINVSYSFNDESETPYTESIVTFSSAQC